MTPSLEDSLVFRRRNTQMLHKDTLESYRRMTPGQRLQMTLEMIRGSEPFLFHGTADQVDRKFELLRRQNDDRSRRMLAAITRTRELP